jgi:hypothetical protein
LRPFDFDRAVAAKKAQQRILRHISVELYCDHDAGAALYRLFDTGRAGITRLRAREAAGKRPDITAYASAGNGSGHHETAAFA